MIMQIFLYIKKEQADLSIPLAMEIKKKLLLLHVSKSRCVPT